MRTKEYIKAYRKEYQAKNKAKIKAKIQEYALNNKEKIREYRKKYRKENAQHIKENKKVYSKIYKLNNKEILAEKRRKRENKRHQTDLLYKIKKCLKSRTLKTIKALKLNKTQRFNKYIGCTVFELKQHLESKFTEGMSWDNHALKGWHIDHIIPLSSAKTVEELYKLNHYTNLQPLWAKDNMAKGAKIIIDNSNFINYSNSEVTNETTNNIINSTDTILSPS